ncbi:MAG: ATP-binding protein [Brevefilum sp.]|nr:ATP-binding protein [Brevefilum sp.]MDT8381700.1 ATP-binding protein [Brevefilum sp.]
MLLRLNYLKRIEPFIDKDIVKILTGIRRSGKSTLMQQVRDLLSAKGISDDQIYSVNFEDLRIRSKQIDDLNKEILSHYTGKRLYLFFDEIQELDRWEELISSLRVTIDSDIYLTGSNSRLMSGELATLIAGRYVEIKVYTFSFREIIELNHFDRRQDVERAFQNFIRFGGFPFIHRNQLDPRATFDYLKDLYNSIILKDIIQRYGIRDVELFERIMLYFIENMANTFSSGNLTKYLKQDKRKISNETIYNYISYSEDSMLMKRVSREDIKGKEILKFQEKLYLSDHGFRELIFGSNQRDINRVLENVVFIELLRRGYEVTVGKIDNREIDFIAKKSEEKLYFQVAYLLADADVVNREFGVYQEVFDNYPKYVLSMDQTDFSQEGIIHKNILDWLVE